MSDTATCNEFCGSADAVSNLYKVQTASSGPGLADYNVGVTYEFRRVEPNRCVWERQTLGPFPWDFERLSRYPRGWEFLNIEPVEGKWTWRLSIDNILLALFHGWLHQFDRVDDSIVDPSGNCSIEQTLETYVPLSTDFDVVITPISEPVEPLRVGQSADPCFCFGECPVNTKPHRKYFVKTIGDVTIPFHDVGFLYEVGVDGPDFCNWTDVDMVTEMSGVLSKTTIAPIAPATKAYQWVLFLRNTITVNTISYKLDVQWDNLGIPNSAAQARCDRSFCLKDETATPGNSATIRPVPEWLCTSTEAADWDAKYPEAIACPDPLVQV